MVTRMYVEIEVSNEERHDLLASGVVLPVHFTGSDGDYRLELDSTWEVERVCSDLKGLVNEHQRVREAICHELEGQR